VIAAIELLAASQALHFRGGVELGEELTGVLEAVREISPPVEEDRPLSRDMEAVAAAIRLGRFDRAGCATGVRS
jgi:histidine ammonia-lyase